MTAERSDPPIEIETGPRPEAVVIWLHGLGADGSDFAGIIPELRLPATRAIRFVFPHAPLRPVTLNNGFVMRAWYDIALEEQGFNQNSTDIAHSVTAMHELIARETARGIAASRIVLAGFSQGGVIALHAGLHAPERLAGVMVLSSPIPRLEQMLNRVPVANRTTPVFLAHGLYDPMVPVAYGEATHAALKARGFDVEWHSYPMQHSVVIEEIRAIADWLQRVVPEGRAPA